MLTYGGIPLALPTDEIHGWIAENISYRDLPIFTYRAFPGKNLTGLTVPTGFFPMKAVRLNRLYWYTGASRWGYGHFLCSRDQLQQIQTLAMGSDCSKMVPLPLAMDDSNGGKIAPSLYLADQTALSGIRGVNGMYMITLVDPRYYWWFVPTPDFGIGPTTTWDSLFAACQTKLGSSIARDTIPASYLQPSPMLNLKYETLPLVLDAIAANVGQRITLGINDGVIRSQSFTTSQAVLETNMTTNFAKQRAGGRRYVGSL